MVALAALPAGAREERRQPGNVQGVSSPVWLLPHHQFPGEEAGLESVGWEDQINLFAGAFPWPAVGTFALCPWQ